MPYGAVPAWCFPVFEFSLYLLFVFCWWNARKKSLAAVAYLFGGFVFGVLLEYMEVQMGSYTYGRFAVMLGVAPVDVPICIGVAWGIIMYTARLLSDWLGLPLWAAAAFDTLLALNIDLSIDVVAYRMHMWQWDWSHTSLNPLTAQWFGIPFANFFGWQTVVFCYSAFSRLLERLWRSRPGLVQSGVTVLMSIVCSLGVLYTTEMIFPYLTRLGILSVHRFLVLCVLLVVLVFFGWRRKQVTASRLPVLTWIAPFWFHLFFVGCFFILDFYEENRWLTVATCLNLFVGLILHTAPLALKRNKEYSWG
jgi:hypothetical protein